MLKIVKLTAGEARSHFSHHMSTSMDFKRFWGKILDIPM